MKSQPSLDAWVRVREVGAAYGFLSDEQIDQVIAGHGVKVLTDWQGRKVIHAKDAARIIAAKTEEQAANAALVSKFDAYLAEYGEAGREAARRAYGHVYERWRGIEERALWTGSYYGMSFRPRFGQRRWSGSPECQGRAHTAAVAAKAHFNGNNAAPLPFGEWRKAGAPESVFKNREKAIDAAVQAGIAEGMK